MPLEVIQERLRQKHQQQQKKKRKQEKPKKKSFNSNAEFKFFENSKRLSSRECKLRNKEEERHKNKVDKILNANGLQRIEIPQDGDCFFQAVCFFICGLTTEKLRQECFRHILTNIETYSPFLTGNQTVGDFTGILKKGHWKNDCMDFLPLAVANIFQHNILIFSSKEHQSVLEVLPNLKVPAALPGCKQPIILAYIAVPGREHFDSVAPIKPTITTVAKPGVKLKDMQPNFPKYPRATTKSAPSCTGNFIQ